MAPTENQEFIAQLAQFSSLEGIQELNDNMLGLAVLQQSNALMAQLTQSSDLIGKTVKYIDPSTNAESSGDVESVKIKDGIAVLNIGSKDIPLGNVTEVLASNEPVDEATEDSSSGSGS
jgi:flagellar basal-body rod modification protein FlgD